MTRRSLAIKGGRGEQCEEGERDENAEESLQIFGQEQKLLSIRDQGED